MTSSGPLQGIRILDLSIAATGPYAVALLADQGAEVVKVERPGFGEIGRWIGIQVDGISALYQVCNRGKRCIAVEPRRAAGREIVRELAAAQRRRGAELAARRGRTGSASGTTTCGATTSCTCRSRGSAARGPYAHKGAYDTVIQAYGGIGWSQADPGTGEPEFVRQVMADKVTALSACQAITAGTAGARARSRRTARAPVDARRGRRPSCGSTARATTRSSTVTAPSPASFSAGTRPFRFTDGWAVATPTANSDFFGMCRAFGVDGWDDPRLASPSLRQQNIDLSRVLTERCHEAAATMTTSEGMARMEAERVPCGVVYSPAELADDPHAQAIGLLVDDVHPIAGRIRQPRHPVLFDDTPAPSEDPRPTLGADTDAVLTELGFADRIEAWRELRRRRDRDRSARTPQLR